MKMMMKNRKKGVALLYVTSLASLLLLIAITAGVNAVSNLDLTVDEKVRTKLEFACESGINRAKAKIEQSFNNGNLNNLEPDVTFQGSAVDDTGLTPLEKAFDDEFFTTSSTDYYSFTIVSDDGSPDIEVRYAITNGRPDDEDGWVKSEDYTTNKVLIEAVAAIPGQGWIGMTEEVYSMRTSLFKYQIFFENDLEILPGPNFNLTGLIHSNEDIYLNSNNTLNIYTDGLTSAGEIHRGRLDKTEVGGTVKITASNEDGSLVTMYDGDDCENADWVDVATSNWKGTVKDQHLGATVQEAPDLQSFEPGGYYDQNAGISILVDTSGEEVLYKIAVDGGLATSYTSAELGDALTESLVYDYREYPSGGDPANNTPVTVTNLDIKKLESVIGASSNGVVYMTKDNAIPDMDDDEFSPDPNRVVSGFKMVNSSTINNPTTFVSDLPVYVEGDFNLHTSDDPGSDTWQPCAIISDAITLLSNNWDDSKSNWKDPAVDSSPSLPTASDTEYNFVFITGNTPTEPGQYSGGLENFPRFLENWSGKDVDISGGFIQLFRSQYATGLWEYGNFYKAPVRNWGAEPRFANLEDLPPTFVDMFPSASINMISSGWSLISKSESEIGSDLGGGDGSGE